MGSQIIMQPGQQPGHKLFSDVIWSGMTWYSAATALQVIELTMITNLNSNYQIEQAQNITLI